MLTRSQQVLLKRAQREAGIEDAEYRASLAIVSGLPECWSSKDPRLTDAHMDSALSYFEAIHWRKVDAGELQGSCKLSAVFRNRGYWAGKNCRGNTSRDRHAEIEMGKRVVALEDDLASLGYGMAYFSAIQNRIQPFSLAKYLGALTRTLAAKRRKISSQA